MKNYFEKNKERILGSYFELLRFPSVGADKVRLGDCSKCAVWIRGFLNKLGFKVELIQPDGMLDAPPVVFAQRDSDGSSHTVLFYGHYDVQPADPLEQWKTDPFEPVISNGRVYARGAQDDKGQWFAFLTGLATLIESGEKLPSLKIVLEGQEESGSAALSMLAPSMKERLGADVLCVCDTSESPDGRPAIVAGLRGVIHCEVLLSGPSYDLHSGIHGGLAPNPAQGIAELAASLHNPDGSIAVEGFCDGIEKPSEEELSYAESTMQDALSYEKAVGCPPLGGERSKGMAERNAFMPTIEVNGIHSGYGGPGGKTVIPSQAVLKFSMRLVPGQTPLKVFDALERHLTAHCPPGMKIEVVRGKGGAGGFRLPMASPVFAVAQDVLKGLDPRGPVFQWDGASIPVVSVLRDVSGAAPLMVGFGREEDRIHSPNESYSFEQFVKAMQWGRDIIKAFA